MKADVLLGLQWGDEGKGKIIDFLAKEYDIVCRFQGGPNAGHSIEFNDIKHVLHIIPSGIFCEHVINVIGNGVVLDPVKFFKEIFGYTDTFGKKITGLIDYIPLEELKKRIVISNNAHLILPSHVWLDEAEEKARGTQTIGTTLSGIGETYKDKIGRYGLRIGDIKLKNFKEKYEKLLLRHESIINRLDPGFFQESYYCRDEVGAFLKAIEFLKEFDIRDTSIYLNNALKEKKRIFIEGAQGSLLDIDFGSYPYVTSSNTTIGGVLTGLGIGPHSVGKIYGLFKAYTTRVGNGPFPTKLSNDIGKKIQKDGNEFGATTGRPRDCGWLDLVALKYVCVINGVTDLIMSKADVLSGLDEIKICVDYNLVDEEIIVPIYKEFPGWKSITKKNGRFTREFREYKAFIEKEVGLPITIISTGPNRREVIRLSKFSLFFRKFILRPKF